MQAIIFTDLDGTLLDFQDYSYQVAEPVVNRLQLQRVPLVFCSSKTRVEQEYYREALGNTDPFIVENGSAIYIPQNYFSFDLATELPTDLGILLSDSYSTIVLGESYSFIRNIIERCRDEVGISIQGYADLSTDQIREITKLGLEFSHRAASREFSETLLSGKMSGETFQALVDCLNRKGLSCVSGGKFHTVMGQGSDKGRAVQILSKLFQREYGEIETIGLGDSANDLPFLNVVDKPFLLQKPDGSWLSANMQENIQKVNKVGPEGWLQVVQSLLTV